MIGVIGNGGIKGEDRGLHAADHSGSQVTGILEAVGSKLQYRAAVLAEVAAGALHTQLTAYASSRTSIHPV